MRGIFACISRVALSLLNFRLYRVLTAIPEIMRKMCPTYLMRTNEVGPEYPVCEFVEGEDWVQETSIEVRYPKT